MHEFKHLRWTPHLLSSSQKVSRVKLSKSLLSTIQKVKRFGYKFIYTGD